jgi:choline dehydrogenase
MGGHQGSGNWDYAHCLPYFQKMEYRLKGAEYQGRTGGQYLTTPKCDNPLFDAFFAAVQQAGYPLTSDVNGFQQEGFRQV